MTQTIEQLQARVAELEEVHRQTVDNGIAGFNVIRQQLAAAQEDITEMRADHLKLVEENHALRQQRDLAVSTIENLVKQKGRHNTEIAYKKLVETLDAIKESEEK